MVWTSEVAQSCPNLCDPMDCSLPGSSIHGIFQARVLEWAAISFSRGSSWPRDRSRISQIAGRHFTIWTTGEAHQTPSNQQTIKPLSHPKCLAFYQACDAVDGEAQGCPRGYMTREKCPLLSLPPSLMKLLNQGPCEALGHRAQGRNPQEALLMGNSRFSSCCPGLLQALPGDLLQLWLF